MCHSSGPLCARRDLVASGAERDRSQSPGISLMALGLAGRASLAALCRGLALGWIDAGNRGVASQGHLGLRRSWHGERENLNAANGGIPEAPARRGQPAEFPEPSRLKRKAQNQLLEIKNKILSQIMIN
jgi:hypothetical protein